ncbi:hypothetical protein GC176_16850 [bacterium]|nr:hypothetical protein [bacterium]
MADATDALGKLPDVCFDWYARLLPGVSGLGLFFLVSDQFSLPQNATELILFLFTGYVIGHILQPASSFVVDSARRRFFPKQEDEYRRAKHSKEIGTSLLSKVSKAHAEAVSMVSFAFVLALDAIAFMCSSDDPSCPMSKVGWFAFGCLMFLVFGFERVRARAKKIDDLKSPGAGHVDSFV